MKYILYDFTIRRNKVNSFVSDPIVRDAASETLGMLVKLIGEPSMTKLMPDLDPIKLTKIKEFAEKAEITGKRPKLQPEGGNAPQAKGGAKVVKPGGPQKKPSTGVRPGTYWLLITVLVKNKLSVTLIFFIPELQY